MIEKAFLLTVSVLKIVVKKMAIELFNEIVMNFKINKTMAIVSFKTVCQLEEVWALLQLLSLYF